MTACLRTNSTAASSACRSSQLRPQWINTKSQWMQKGGAWGSAHCLELGFLGTTALSHLPCGAITVPIKEIFSKGLLDKRADLLANAETSQGCLHGTCLLSLRPASLQPPGGPCTTTTPPHTHTAEARAAGLNHHFD